MAAVVIASTYAVGHPQADGRHYVTETHTDSAGGIHVIEYLAAIDADYAAICSARVVLLDDWLAAGDVSDADLSEDNLASD